MKAISVYLSLTAAIILVILVFIRQSGRDSINLQISESNDSAEVAEVPATKLSQAQNSDTEEDTVSSATIEKLETENETSSNDWSNLTYETLSERLVNLLLDPSDMPENWLPTEDSFIEHSANMLEGPFEWPLDKLREVMDNDPTVLAMLAGNGETLSDAIQIPTENELRLLWQTNPNVREEASKSLLYLWAGAKLLLLADAKGTSLTDDQQFILNHYIDLAVNSWIEAFRGYPELELLAKISTQVEFYDQNPSDNP